MFKKIIYFIFSAVNRGKYKVITVFGFKFKFRIMRFDIQNLERTLSARIGRLENMVESSIDIRKLPPSCNLTGKIQKASFKILREFDGICRRNNLKYWLDFGTLLGAVRHGGFIPWDDDLDVGMPYADYQKLLEIIDSQLEGTDFNFIRVPSQIGKMTHKQFTPQNDRDMSRFIFWNLEGKLSFALDIFPFYNAKDELDKDSLAREIRDYVCQKSRIIEKFRSYNDFCVADDIVKNARRQMAQEGPSQYMYLGLETRVYQPVIRNTSDMFPLKEMMFESLRCYVPNNARDILIDLYGDFMSFPPNEVFHHIKNSTIDKQDLKKLETIIDE